MTNNGVPWFLGFSGSAPSASVKPDPTNYTDVYEMKPLHYCELMLCCSIFNIFNLLPSYWVQIPVPTPFWILFYHKSLPNSSSKNTDTQYFLSMLPCAQVLRAAVRCGLVHAYVLHLSTNLHFAIEAPERPMMSAFVMHIHQRRKLS
jgi:hypothetical protein